MGWCHEFGAQVREGCDHPMEAGAGACSCAVCGTACGGRFAGCDLVWARGARPVARVAPPAVRVAPALEAPAVEDHRPDDLARLLTAVDALRDDVAALAAALASRTEALDASSTRLADLVGGLPARIGDAVRMALHAPAGNGAVVPPPPTPEPAAGAGTQPAHEGSARRLEWDALRTRLAALTREPPASG